MNFGTTFDDCLRIVKINTFFNRRFSQNFHFIGEEHDFMEIVFVLSGKLGVTAGERVVVLSKGECIIHPPSEFHAQWSAERSRPEVIIVSFSASKFPKLNQFVWKISDEQISELRYIYASIGDIFQKDNVWLTSIKSGKGIEAEMFKKKLELFLLGVISSSTPILNHKSTQSSLNYERIITVMKENLHSSITLEEIAALCGISVSSLEKTVKKYLHRGAITHFNAMKMQEAVHLLDSDKSVKEIAYSLGFSNQNYFNTVFRKHYGMSPTKYKKLKENSL